MAEKLKFEIYIEETGRRVAYRYGETHRRKDVYFLTVDAYSREDAVNESYELKPDRNDAEKKLQIHETAELVRDYLSSYGDLLNLSTEDLETLRRLAEDRRNAYESYAEDAQNHRDKQMREEWQDTLCNGRD